MTLLLIILFHFNVTLFRDLCPDIIHIYTIIILNYNLKIVMLYSHSRQRFDESKNNITILFYVCFPPPSGGCEYFRGIYHLPETIYPWFPCQSYPILAVCPVGKGIRDPYSYLLVTRYFF